MHMFGNDSEVAMNGGYSYCIVQYDNESRRMDHTVDASECYKTKDGEYYKFTTTDTISVHLDLHNRTVGISKNDEEIVIVFGNVKRASYRFAVTVWRDTKRVLEFCD